MVFEERNRGYLKKIGIGILYGIVCVGELWTYILVLVRGGSLAYPTYWAMAIDAYCAFICWTLAIERNLKSERLAAILMAALFLSKIGLRFTAGESAVVLRGIGCAAVVVGAFALGISFVNSRSHTE